MKDARRKKAKARRKESLAARRKAHGHRVKKDTTNDKKGHLVEMFVGVNAAGNKVTDWHRTYSGAYKALRKEGISAKLILG